MCGDNYDKTGGYPVRPVDEAGNKIPWGNTPFILMIDRGGCTFVKKVRNAQRAGAAAAIIADMTCLCMFEETCHVPPEAQCEDREPVMADDGSGSDISIPSFLMFKQDADPVKATLMANVPVRMELQWSLPNPTDTVNYELWTTPADQVSEEFQMDFKEAAISMGEKAVFTPHMYFYDGYKSGCVSGGENMCYNLCTNNGRYCATDPDNDLDKGISGAQVVVESLRRLCIWKHYGDNGVGKEWWDYVHSFISTCGTDYFADEACVSDSLKQAGIDINIVEQCMDDSGGVEDDVENTMLSNELVAKDATGIVILPVVYVNGASIRGALEFSTMFKAVCAGFKDGTAPPICQKCAVCHDEKVCVHRGYCTAPPGTQGSVSKQTFTWSIFGIFIAFTVVAFAGYKYHQRRMRTQIRGILAEYMPIDKEGNLHETAIEQDDMELS